MTDQKLSFLAILGLSALVGCGEAQPAPAAKGPTEGFIQSYQNTAGCLDLEKLSKALYEAKTERTTLRDVTVLSDGTPVSGKFTRAGVRELLQVNDGAVESIDHDALSNFKQSGCKSVSWVEFSGIQPLALIITSSSPTKLELSSSSDGKRKLIFEITADNELQLTEIASLVVGHDCAQSSVMDEHETHSVVATTTLQWGTELPAKLGTSLKFAALLEIDGKYENDDADTLREMKSQEADYCSKSGE